MNGNCLQPSVFFHSANRILAAILLLGLGLFSQPAAALATTIAVTTTNDEIVTNGNCSLREAIRAANIDAKVDACPAGSGIDGITLPAGTYALSLAGGNEDGNMMGDLDISSSLTITGAGVGSTLIDGHQLDRVFHILTGAVVALGDLTITNGHAPNGVGTVDGSGLSGQDGGGIYNSGYLTLHNVAVTGNQAGSGSSGANVDCSVSNRFCTANGGAGGRGGGIFNNMELTLQNVTLGGNLSGSGGAGGSNNCSGLNSLCFADGGFSGSGGGLVSNTSSAVVTITSSRLDGNGTGAGGAPGTIITCGSGSSCSTSAGNEGDGGGIFMSTGTLSTVESTISNNSSRNRGGGIYCQGSSCSFERSTFHANSAGTSGGALVLNQNISTFLNVTISNNSSLQNGGGLAVLAGLVNLNFVTLANNTADSDANGSGNGGGVYNPSGTLEVKNSIIADNTDTGGQAPDCSGNLTSLKYNHIESLAGCTYQGTVQTGDVFDTDPGLIMLANYGGATLTQRLVPGSPAIDAIPNGENTCGTSVTKDQRLSGRPADGNGDGQAACDKGAFEIGANEQRLNFLYLPQIAQ
jgi:CSLREA domain-containing protein